MEFSLCFFQSIPLSIFLFLSFSPHSPHLFSGPKSSLICCVSLGKSLPVSGPAPPSD